MIAAATLWFVLLYVRIHTLLVRGIIYIPMKRLCRCSGSQGGQQNRSRTCGCFAADERYRVLPKSKLEQAIKYVVNQWEKYSRRMDGCNWITTDANWLSSHYVIGGRENELFADTPKGVKTSAITYSLIETAKENGLKPYEYLR